MHTQAFKPTPLLTQAFKPKPLLTHIPFLPSHNTLIIPLSNPSHNTLTLPSLPLTLHSSLPSWRIPTQPRGDRGAERDLPDVRQEGEGRVRGARPKMPVGSDPRDDQIAFTRYTYTCTRLAAFLPHLPPLFFWLSHRSLLLSLLSSMHSTRHLSCHRQPARPSGPTSRGGRSLRRTR